MGFKRKQTEISNGSTDIIESSQAKKSREQTYMTQDNIISSKRRRINKK